MQEDGNGMKVRVKDERWEYRWKIDVISFLRYWRGVGMNLISKYHIFYDYTIRGNHYHNHHVAAASSDDGCDINLPLKEMYTHVF